MPIGCTPKSRASASIGVGRPDRLRSASTSMLLDRDHVCTCALEVLDGVPLADAEQAEHLVLERRPIGLLLRDAPRVPALRDRELHPRRDELQAQLDGLGDLRDRRGGVGRNGMEALERVVGQRRGFVHQQERC